MLGPTNTGKTHRAIERMLECESGMFGLPLRLLAREVYDRISVRVGESQVALITGEEKRVPANPRYWISTVEAMPVHHSTEFVAIDEVQLIANSERGHIFTDRVLHARGTKTTWFLGADTARPLLRELLPGLAVTQSPRMSVLSAQKPLSLRSIPRRSAVITFSLPRVFELARALRALRGGAAVVIGAMSPRTRNAQVAMYEAGEVDFVVATDAIGMGLNLDIDHVAFADLRKFDGKVERALEASELAQIAGRAGRYTKNGTFGVLTPLSGFPRELARRVEQHSFPRLESAFYRNSTLDFSSPLALLTSLRLAAPSDRLRRTRNAMDELVFEHLSSKEEIARRLETPEQVQLLWQVATIPDYRQLLFAEHAAQLESIFLGLYENHTLDPSWVRTRLRAISDFTADDPETLLDRIADVRLWNYVANQADWVDPRAGLEQEARAVEDRLSDALHRAVIARFVSAERPAPRPTNSSKAREQAAGSPFAKLAALLKPEQPQAEVGFSFEGMLEADQQQFEVDELGRIVWRETAVGRLSKGRDITSPEVVVLLEVASGARLQAHRRLVAFAKDWTLELLRPLQPSPALSPALRGLLYLVQMGLGTADAAATMEHRNHLTDADRAAMKRIGLTLGRFSVFSSALLRPRAVATRLLLTRAFHQVPTRAQHERYHWPTGKEVSVQVDPQRAPSLYWTLGYPVIGSRAVRADILERTASELEEEDADLRIARIIGCSRREASALRDILARRDLI